MANGKTISWKFAVICDIFELMGAKREIWVRWYRRGIFLGAKPIHWKGHALMFAPFVLIGALAYITEKQIPFVVLYWFGAFIGVAVYWMLMLDHSEWERPAS